jgi:hypothetical protein
MTNLEASIAMNQQLVELISHQVARAMAGNNYQPQQSSLPSATDTSNTSADAAGAGKLCCSCRCHNNPLGTHSPNTRISSAEEAQSMYGGEQGYDGFGPKSKPMFPSSSYEQYIDIKSHEALALEWGYSNARTLGPLFARTRDDLNTAIRLKNNPDVPLTDEHVIKFIENVKAR